MSLVSLLQTFRVDPPAAEATYKKILLAYSEAGRFYHTIVHIRQVLDSIDFLIAAGGSSLERDGYRALVLAAWFHDVVYDPQKSDNEARSAVWMETELNPLGIPEPILQQASKLILATHSHLAPPGDLLTPNLLDSDLSILGASPERYDAYASAIRQEYAFLPEEAFRSGRRAVLERFLSRPRIFLTQAAHFAWEEIARENMKREISAGNAEAGD
jgi:predicted metal-dependent HD superfamily phosphohydrolase